MLTGCIAQTSQAKKITDAAGLSLYDVPEEKMPKSIQKDGNGVFGFAGAASIPVGTAAHVFTPEAGLSVGAATGLSLLSILSSTAKKPEQWYRIIAWAPKDFASDVENAREKMKRLIGDAFSAAIQDPISAQELDKLTRQSIIRIEAPHCLCAILINTYSKPHIDQAPEWLGHYSSYAWTPVLFNSSMYFSPGYPMADKSKSLAEKMDVFKRVSEKLPAWAYIYVPADPQGSPVPVVYSQGRALLFVRP